MRRQRTKFGFPGDVVLCSCAIRVRCLIFQRVFNSKLVEAIHIKSEVATILNGATLMKIIMIIIIIIIILILLLLLLLFLLLLL